MGKLVEEWRDIEGYEGYYQVSDWGRVKNQYDRILKHYLAGKAKDYHYVKLHKNKEIESFLVSRLVAISFIPNPQNKPQIDHINGDKNDNSAWNLRWATQLENQRNPITREKRFNNPKTSTLVCQYTLDGELVKIWSSLHEAERSGFGRKEIKKCCLGLLKQHKGYKWSYIPL